MALAGKVKLADEVVREYLLRCGLASTFDAFEEDCKHDPLEAVPPVLLHHPCTMPGGTETRCRVVLLLCCITGTPLALALHLCTLTPSPCRRSKWSL